MRDIFLLLLGSLLSFLGSIVANRLFFGKIERKRAAREAQRAYNRLVSRLLHTTVADINQPLELLPLEISDRVEDLKFALEDVNAKFEHVQLVHKAIEQATELRKKQA
jgi:hypothetical protein